MVRISATACATAKPFIPTCSSRDGDCWKICGLPIWTTSWSFFMSLTTSIASNKRNLKIKWFVSQQCLCYSKTVTSMCSPRDGDCWKISGLPIWTTLWPYFFTSLTTSIASNKINLNIKWFVSQQLLVLQQNRLHRLSRDGIGKITILNRNLYVVLWS